MSATQTTLEPLFAGESHQYVVTVATAAGAAYDLTNHTAEWCLAAKAGEVALVRKTTSSGIALTTPASGVLTVTLGPTDTHGRVGNYYWELRVVDPSGNEDVAAYGTLPILGSTTDVSPSA